MDDLELLRSFRADVEPPDPERVAHAHRALVTEYDDAPARPRRRGRSKRALAGLVAVPAAAAGAAVLLVAGTLGGGTTGTADAAIIRHVDAALSPPGNEILHTKVAGGGFVAEWWQLTSPPYSFLGIKGPVGAAPEEAGSGTTASYYDPGTNTIHQQPGNSPTAFIDPLAQVRQALHDGRARVLGNARIDGADTYEIQFADKNGFDQQSLVAYVDQHTYRPVMLSDPQRNGSIVRLRVVTFEYLPATPATRGLLSLTSRHPAARVVTDTSAKPLPAGK
jgi:hypothetical protein